LSGGNPAIHDLDGLVQLLHTYGFSVNIETQGTIYRSWISDLDCITVSPKPPSAGNDPKLGVERVSDFLDKLSSELSIKLQSYDPPVCLKVPVEADNTDDFKFAKSVFHMALGKGLLWIRPYVSVVTTPDDTAESLLTKYRVLAEKICADHKFPDVQVLPQLHVLMWSHARGV
jgi:7-carboxy-7-deazaguanine synthase